MLNLNEIQVTNLDKTKVDEILKTINQLSQNSDKQELKLLLNSVTGNTESAMEIVNAAHSQDIVDLVIEVSGKNNTAGTILTAAGLPGKRSAKPGVSFCLNDEDPYPEDANISDFDPHDKSVYEIVKALTGKSKPIANEIINAAYFNSKLAKKYNIIDESPKFASKYSCILGNKKNSSNNSIKPKPTQGIINSSDSIVTVVEPESSNKINKETKIKRIANSSENLRRGK
jgi:hypothetical protein